jgi:hypothetical protein
LEVSINVISLIKNPNAMQEFHTTVAAMVEQRSHQSKRSNNHQQL